MEQKKRKDSSNKPKALPHKAASSKRKSKAAACKPIFSTRAIKVIDSCLAFGRKYYLQAICAVLLAFLIVMTILIIGNFNAYANPVTASEAQVQPLSFTVFGGETVKDLDERLAMRSMIKKGQFISTVKDYAKEMGLAFYEGWLQAGTYALDRENPARSLASQMLAATCQTLSDRSEELGSFSPQDIVIIASMIERETDNDEDLALISSVIHNRLELGMPLGIDATTRYEIDDWQRPLESRDFESSSSFNTRRLPGLPETGIGCPAASAIIAALEPADTDYLYYRHDKYKVIHLSRTYEEHLASIMEHP
ncbi:MAG: endolytic transglycosylase MltG [Sphaerochaetaceae bacterium]|jgi:UPF0755 protein|nr:endolytic transglycosylase MltG [Sphaerochaetaceae bacterium]